MSPIGETSLLIAVQKNNESMIQFLLHLGAHPDRTDFKRRTPLMHAVEHGHVEAVETLLNANAKTNVRDLEGQGIIMSNVVTIDAHEQM